MAEVATGVRRWNVPVLVVGGILAVGAFVASFLIANHSAATGPTPTAASVVVAARDLDARATLAAADLSVVKYSPGDVPPGAITSVAAGAGMVLQVPLRKGQPLLANLIAKVGEIGNPALGTVQVPFLPLDKGTVATTLPTAELVGVGDYIRAGDYIDVVAVVQPKGGGTSNVRTIYSGVHVIRVGLSGQQPGSGSGAASSLTVAVTQCQAEYLSWFVANATIKYTLLSSQDYQAAAQAPGDSTCPATGSKGVNDTDIKTRWPGLLG